MKDNNKKKIAQPKQKGRFWSFLGAAAAAFAFFYLLFLVINYYDDKEVALIDSDMGVADGLIVKTGSKKGSYAIAQYHVNGKEFTIEGSSPAEDIRKGQKFRIKYYNPDPEKARILFEQPFFDVTDKIDSTYGSVQVLDKFKIRFNYTLNAVSYDKIQRRMKDVPLHDGDEFRVYYLKDSPRVAFIVIDKPADK